MFAIKNSSILLLPQWRAILKHLEMDNRIMPHDVSTCWNLTYNMLAFAIDYRDTLVVITGEKDMKLWRYEMNKGEWAIAEELCGILKVCALF